MDADGSIDQGRGPDRRGVWLWPGGSLTWTFEPADGWEVDGVTDALMIAFASGGLVVPAPPWSRPPLWARVGPGQHWSVVLPRALSEQTGARVYYRVVSKTAAVFWNTVDTSGGFLYLGGHVNINTDQLIGPGRVTGGSGKLRGARGTFTAKPLNKSGSRTAVVITYRSSRA